MRELLVSLLGPVVVITARTMFLFVTKIFPGEIIDLFSDLLLTESGESCYLKYFVLLLHQLPVQID